MISSVHAFCLLSYSSLMLVRTYAYRLVGTPKLAKASGVCAYVFSFMSHCLARSVATQPHWFIYCFIMASMGSFMARIGRMRHSQSMSILEKGCIREGDSIRDRCGSSEILVTMPARSPSVPLGKCTLASSSLEGTIGRDSSICAAISQSARNAGGSGGVGCTSAISIISVLSGHDRFKDVPVGKLNK